MKLSEIVGAVLRRLRIKRRLKQYEVAARAGVTTAKLSAVERGLSEPGFELTLRLLRAIGASWMEFAEMLNRAGIQAWAVREIPEPMRR